MPRPAFAALLLAVLAAAPAQAATIHIAGDSTAATYEARRYPQTGWGQMLHCALDDTVTVRNHARGGRSTRTFINEGRLDRIAEEIKPGDTLLIQFGHNDANTVKIERYADPMGAYRSNLARMIAVARSAGAQPVLITPVIRRNWKDGRVQADFTPWSNAARQLARELNVPLIDLEQDSRKWVEAAGEEGSKRYFLHYTAADAVPAFPKGIDDDTHFSEIGARGIAEIVARDLKALGLPVSQHILADRPDLARTTPLGRAECH
ncbi:rhamnogalacturonan acetylesterase [Pedomonas mirosovicensis]|uniref:rhamnogalacturonan acetylesterase n=1 Tax=Pedomonas mirosovicensis TaxID=2908641 RepID=UPI00216A19B1|nr:rhamnogalacturonan acetylesterase [Pedomonas mirosovicensis]MCH8686181.1 rhamnogalacturonan acetylesterase [Pedomonas mirosovicensis]